MAIFLGAIGVSFLSLWSTDGALSPAFKGINFVLLPLGALFGALSFAFFNYLEGVLKDIPKKLNSLRPKEYSCVVSALTKLKKEVIVNVLLVIFLLLIAFLLAAGVEVLTNSVVANVQLLWWVMAMHGACLITAVVAVVGQMFGFITANDLRAEISSYQD